MAAVLGAGESGSLPGGVAVPVSTFGDASGGPTCSITIGLGSGRTCQDFLLRANGRLQRLELSHCVGQLAVAILLAGRSSFERLLGLGKSGLQPRTLAEFAAPLNEQSGGDKQGKSGNREM